MLFLLWTTQNALSPTHFLIEAGDLIVDISLAHLGRTFHFLNLESLGEFRFPWSVYCLHCLGSKFFRLWNKILWPMKALKKDVSEVLQKLLIDISQNSKHPIQKVVSERSTFTRMQIFLSRVILLLTVI